MVDIKLSTVLFVGVFYDEHSIEMQLIYFADELCLQSVIAGL